MAEALAGCGQDGARRAQTPEGPGAQGAHRRPGATVDGMFLRIIIHDNEHMGQLIAYARMTGVTPPWANN